MTITALLPRTNCTTFTRSTTTKKWASFRILDFPISCISHSQQNNPLRTHMLFVGQLTNIEKKQHVILVRRRKGLLFPSLRVFYLCHRVNRYWKLDVEASCCSTAVRSWRGQRLILRQHCGQSEGADKAHAQVYLHQTCNQVEREKKKPIKV